MVSGTVPYAVMALLGIGFILRRAHGSWLAPGPFLALFWTAGLALPPLVAPTFYSSDSAVWYVVALVGGFCLGSWVAAGHIPTRPVGVTPHPFHGPLLRGLAAAGTVTGVLATVIVQMANGYSVTSIFSAQALMNAAAAFSQDRYTGQSSTPLVVPLLMSITYAAAIVAPLAARGLPRRHAISCVVGPLAASFLYALLTTARAGMLMVAFFLAASWLAARVHDRGETLRMSPRAVITALGAGLAVATAFIGIAFVRVGSFSADMRQVIAEKLVGYAVGYMPVFSQYFTDSAPTFPERWGTATFAGISGSSGGQSRGYDDFLPLGPGLSVSNIYSVWRFLIDDFGIVGAPIAAALLGFAATRAWTWLIRRPNGVSLVMLACAYAFTLNSSTQPPFMFTNVALAIGLAAVVLSWPAGAVAVPPGTEAAARTSPRTWPRPKAPTHPRTPDRVRLASVGAPPES
ncbi:O-antigen polymerase [Modestobacter sp. KNN46-3]|uniref:O-antigen polymerase n=1 Tax=Modestobacter sp. KNN46-3 TaxID=2711218 RepID=UPI0019D156BF|nr:O-antigen polymerase [Modestobacter sp. KNN46-3]